MRNFIIVGHRAVTYPPFSLNDLPGTGGRVDILARSINVAFLLSHGMREGVEVTTVLLGPEDPPKNIRFIGTELKYLNPDERSTGALSRNALIKYNTMKTNPEKKQFERSLVQNDILGNELRSSPGVYISNSGFAEILRYYSEHSILVCLIEKGSDLSNLTEQLKNNYKQNLTFILSDDKDFTAEEEDLINKYSKFSLSLGPQTLHSDHCIILIHNILDNLEIKNIKP
jgi:tRNA (pseudouridine54-N1)-methyltransferase